MFISLLVKIECTSPIFQIPTVVAHFRANKKPSPEGEGKEIFFKSAEFNAHNAVFFLFFGRIILLHIGRVRCVNIFLCVATL